jgi:hypothetical protein
MTRASVALAIVSVLVACASKPPPDFAPDPALVARIEAIRVVPRTENACPGGRIRADYEAVLDDGTVLPFSRDYDDDNPPSLHVVFLSRLSPEAASHEDGDWTADRDPLRSAMEGFRLTAVLRARPELTATAVVAPEYSCVPHAFGFSGATGLPGPDVLLRLGTVRSPFYDRLLVLAVEVGDAPPFYVLHDADLVPPSDWYVVGSQGGRGERGARGAQGGPGAEGRAGCPGGPGGAGGIGQAGGMGAPGGPGGSVTLLVPEDERFLAGLVDARSVGGPGGPGGRGGEGGPGGPGGQGILVNGQRCENGPAGPQGRDGPEGGEGPSGPPGNPPRVITVPSGDVFSSRVPQALQALLDFSRN